MWKTSAYLFTFLYLFLYLISASTVDADVYSVVWKDVSRGIKDSDLLTVTVNPENADTVYISSSSTVYKTINGGEDWDNVLSFRGTGNPINSIAISPINTEVVYAGTQDGLYRSRDGGTNWKSIFKSIGELKRSILSITINPVNPEVIFIGTKAGIFWTNNMGNDWRKGQNLPSEAVVSFITIDHSNPHIIYAAVDRGIYKSINGGNDWKRVFETSIYVNEYSTSNQIEAAETKRIETKLRSIAIDSVDTKTVYVATPEGLLVTEDGGLTWKMASSSGLISGDIHHLVVSPADPDGIYAATSRGVFRYSKVSKNWSELYKGLTSTDIRYLSTAPTIRDKSINLWAVTKRGVFKTIPMIQNASNNKTMEVEEVLSNFTNEPSIDEIQQAAIRYAEVHPEKIKRWRKAAAKKAWLPDLKIGYDKDKDWQSSTYFYSSTTQKYKDDDITKGKDWGWSISLTWELGDIIWNNDQTSIDTRSRLMVQLRDDVLNEVTRLYFERRRFQIEMLLSPPEKIGDKIEKELRLKELTADIDALTGFYLSKRLGQMRDKLH